MVSYDYDAVGQRGTMALTAAGQQQQLMELDYTRSLDLSQTLEGARSTGSGPAAGGVGGLFSSASSSASSFFAYDGNGNVVALADAATGTVAAQYDYSPFGETVKATGPAADANPFRFSTKYADGPSPGPELYYYGYRYYSPGLGRWTSRDPSGEGRGGTNLQAFVDNAPAMRYDYLGMWPWTGCCDGLPYNRITHCCCRKRIVSRQPSPTGFRICPAPAMTVAGVDHVWVEWPGPGGSVGFTGGLGFGGIGWGTVIHALSAAFSHRRSLPPPLPWSIFLPMEGPRPLALSSASRT